MALESDAKALISDLNHVFVQNPIIYSAIQENTDIVHRMVMIESKLVRLTDERKVQTDKDSVSDIILDNFDNYGILDADDGADNELRRDLIASILYDLEKVGFAFVRVERSEGPDLTRT